MDKLAVGDQGHPDVANKVFGILERQCNEFCPVGAGQANQLVG
jgi:hypothetical protein